MFLVENQSTDRLRHLYPFLHQGRDITHEQITAWGYVKKGDVCDQNTGIKADGVYGSKQLVEGSLRRADGDLFSVAARNTEECGRHGESPENSSGE